MGHFHYPGLKKCHTKLVSYHSAFQTPANMNRPGSSPILVRLHHLLLVCLNVETKSSGQVYQAKVTQSVACLMQFLAEELWTQAYFSSECNLRTDTITNATTEYYFDNAQILLGR